MGVTRPPLEYLASCSKVSLEAFELSRLNEASNLRKEVQQILQGWIDTEVDARVARWILDTKQSQARGGLQAALGSPVPVKQLDLSFLPLNGAQTSDDAPEVEENTKRPKRARLQQTAHAVLPSADGRTQKENRSAPEKKPAKAIGKATAPAVGVAPGGSAAVRPAGKASFAEEEENALHALERFVQGLRGASCARSANPGATGNLQILGEKPPLVARATGRTRRDPSDCGTGVRVFPSKNAPAESKLRGHPLRAIAISALELAMPAAAHR